MSKRLEILNKIEGGEISPEEGAKLLSNLPQEETPSTEGHQPINEELNILEMIERGEISAEEGIKLMAGRRVNEENDDYEDFGFGESSGASEPPTISEEEIAQWKRWWQIPLYGGAAITGFSALWMNYAFRQTPYGFWFFCTMFPVFAGLMLIALSWQSRSGPWLHVRIKQNQGGPKRISISFPLPIKLSAWVLRQFGHLIPGLGETSLDEVILALDTTAKNDTPLYVQVDEDDNTQVEVFIG